jgi:hypothetical protein
MSCNFNMFPNKNVKSQEGLIPNQINNRTTFPITDPILSQNLNQEQPEEYHSAKKLANISQEQPEEYHSAKKLADERFENSGYKNINDWWRLVCQAIDQKYYEVTGSFKPATTESEIQIWLNILRATVNEIDLNKGSKSLMSKKKIKKRIIEACP